MSKFIIEGGRALTGAVAIQGSKNAAFPVIATSLLTREKCRIRNLPMIADVRNFLAILKFLGAKVKLSGHEAEVNCRDLMNKDLPAELMGKLRGSVLFAGALLARFGKVAFALPGGDKFVARPIDVHLDGFRKLGATSEESELVRVKAKTLCGARIVLGITTVTGTENLILASVLAKGVTELKLAAMEPHVQALCLCLNQMGAKIEGVGTPNLTITGVPRLHGADFTLGGDEIEAVTFCIAAAATQSELTVSGVNPDNLEAPLAVLDRMNVNVKANKERIKIMKPRGSYQATRIVTGVYPQLLTDYQPLLGVLATQAQGQSSIHDWVHEGRQGHLQALQKMGAKVEYDDMHRARIFGPTRLRGVEVKTPDIRAGASILIAALVAKGQSIIYNAEIIDRGYEKLDERLNKLGAKIERVD